MCLICGHVGCSRYVNGHAEHHWNESNHNYALDINNPQRVWDYAEDAYIHRLVLSKTDGKLVEYTAQGHRRSRRRRDEFINQDTHPKKVIEEGHSLSRTHSKTDDTWTTPSSSSINTKATADTTSSSSSSSINMLSPSTSPDSLLFHGHTSTRNAYVSLKLEEFLLEYNYLLSTQLEQQRKQFQGQINHLKEEHKLELLHGEAIKNKKLQEQKNCESKLDTLHKLQAEALEKNNKLTEEFNILQSQETKLKSLNQILLQQQEKNRDSLQNITKQFELDQQKLVAEKDAEIAALEEQLQDLMFYLETQSKITKKGLKEQIEKGQAEITFVPQEEEKKQIKGRKKKR